MTDVALIVGMSGSGKTTLAEQLRPRTRGGTPLVWDGGILVDWVRLVARGERRLEDAFTPMIAALRCVQVICVCEPIVALDRLTRGGRFTYTLQELEDEAKAWRTWRSLSAGLLPTLELTTSDPVGPKLAALQADAWIRTKFAEGR